MELLYIWIEEYKNIHHQGFNFSPKYNFVFDVEKQELISKNVQNSLPDNFFGDNIVNVTGIVGKNGAGKTTLIKAINYAYEFLFWGLNKQKDDYFNTLQDYGERLKTKKIILVYKTLHKFKIFHIDIQKKIEKEQSTNFETENDFFLNPIVKFIEKEFDFRSFKLSDINKENVSFEKSDKLYTQIYYANNFENKKFLKHQVKDISNVGLIYYQATDIDKYQRLFQDDFKRQVIFLDKNPNKIVAEIKKMQFNIPNKFNIKISTRFDGRYRVGNFLKNNHKKNDDISVEKMILYGVLNYIRTIINKKHLKSKYFFTEKIFKDLIVDKEDIILDDFLKNIKNLVDIKKPDKITNDIKFLEELFYANALFTLKKVDKINHIHNREEFTEFKNNLALIKNVVVEKNCYIAKNFIAKLCK